MTQKKRFNPQSAVILGLLHVGAIIGLTRIGSASAKVLILAGALWLLTGLATTVGYHRMETHESFKTSPTVKWILFALGAMTLQGEIRGWVLNHWAHHDFSDEPGLDPHSPREYPGLKGLAWAHMGWLLYHYTPPKNPIRSTLRLDQDRAVRWHSRKRNYLIMVVASFLIPALVAGWDGFWVAGVLRIMVGLHATWSVNSICHKYGKPALDSARKKYLGDDSRNNLLVAILAWGEGYHANHHARQTWAYHGWKWYNWDPSKWVIRSLEILRLVWQVRKPKAEHYYGRSLQTV